MQPVIVSNNRLAQGVRLAAPGAQVRIKGAKLDKRQLLAMSFVELRKYLLDEYVSCSGLTTVDELVAKWETDWDNRMESPLARDRGNGIEKAFMTGKSGRVGLCECKGPGCLKTEDGQKAFGTCGACRGPVYCSAECQRAHWISQHKAECGRLQEQHVLIEESWQQAAGFLKLFGNKAN
jgi:hypothetical protein